jgi:uncharacterized protein (DUF305 family)
MYSTRSTSIVRRSRLTTLAALGIAASAGLLAAGLPGAAAEAPAEQTATPAPTSSPAPGGAPQEQNASPTDVRFAAMMVPHHQTGIELTQMAIDKAATDGVRQVAQEGMQSQQEDLPVLQEIAASGASGHEMEQPLMTFNQQEMAELRSLTGEEFDRKWLDVFSSHHMAAIMMADTALPGATSDRARAIEQKIHDGQLQQLQTMNELREQLDGTQTARVPSGAVGAGGGSTAGLQDESLLAAGAAMIVAGLGAGVFVLRRRASADR